MEGNAVSPCTTPELITKSLNITRAYWRFRLGGSTFGENIFGPLPPKKKKTPYHEKNINPLKVGNFESMYSQDPPPLEKGLRGKVWGGTMQSPIFKASSLKKLDRLHRCLFLFLTNNKM